MPDTGESDPQTSLHEAFPRAGEEAMDACPSFAANRPDDSPGHGAEAFPVRMENGETAEVFLTASGALCPVCGFDGLPELPYHPQSGRPSFGYCSCCDTQFGWDDKVAPDAPAGSKARVWNERRQQWLRLHATEEERLRCQRRFPSSGV